MRKKAAEAAGSVEEPPATVGAEEAAPSRSRQSWAMLIKRVYEVDPLSCPCCGGQMKIVSFIERCQADVIERILRHCGRWEGPLRTLASPRAPPVDSGRAANATGELELVPDADFLESERREQPGESAELQLVLDPDFL